jgi:hypothetical protein
MQPSGMCLGKIQWDTVDTVNHRCWYLGNQGDTSVKKTGNAIKIKKLKEMLASSFQTLNLK